MTPYTPRSSAASRATSPLRGAVSEAEASGAANGERAVSVVSAVSANAYDAYDASSPLVEDVSAGGEEESDTADHHAKRVATAAAVAQAERSARQAALDAERWALEQEEQEQEERARLAAAEARAKAKELFAQRIEQQQQLQQEVEAAEAERARALRETREKRRAAVLEARERKQEASPQQSASPMSSPTASPPTVNAATRSPARRVPVVVEEEEPAETAQEKRSRVLADIEARVEEAKRRAWEADRQLAQQRAQKGMPPRVQPSAEESEVLEASSQTSQRLAELEAKLARAEAAAEAAELKRRSEQLDAEMASLKAKLAGARTTPSRARAVKNSPRSRLAERVARRRSGGQSDHLQSQWAA